MDHIKHIIEELEGSISKENAQSLSLWKGASPDNAQMYDEIVRVWNMTGQEDMDFSKEKAAAYEYISSKIQFPKKKTTIFYIKWAVAASVLLVAMLFAWNALDKKVQLDLPREFAFSTTYEYLDVTLPDASNVRLGPHSALTYTSAFNEQNRELQLDGNAFFDVTKNKSLPFEVHTDNYQIKVLGTAFHLAAPNEENKVKVSVLRGRVEVATRSMKVEIQKKQAVLVGIDNTTIELDSYDPQVVLQAQKPLFFNQITLQDIAAQLEKRFGVQISISPHTIPSCLFSGKFDTQSLDEIITILEKATGLRSKKRSASQYDWLIKPC